MHPCVPRLAKVALRSVHPKSVMANCNPLSDQLPHRAQARAWRPTCPNRSRTRSAQRKSLPITKKTLIHFWEPFRPLNSPNKFYLGILKKLKESTVNHRYACVSDVQHQIFQNQSIASWIEDHLFRACANANGGLVSIPAARKPHVRQFPSCVITLAKPSVSQRSGASSFASSIESTSPALGNLITWPRLRSEKFRQPKHRRQRLPRPSWAGQQDVRT